MKVVLRSFLFLTLTLVPFFYGHGKEPIKTKKTTASPDAQLSLIAAVPTPEVWGIQLFYGGSYNALQTQKVKTLSHRLGLSLSYNLVSSWHLSSSIGVNHMSHGRAIYKSNDSEYFHNLSYADISISKSGFKSFSFIGYGSYSLTYNFPLDIRSRWDKKNGDLSASLFLQSKSWNRLSIYHSTSLSYALHTMRFSSYSGDRLNSNFNALHSLGLSFRFLKKMSLSLSSSLSSSRYLDQTWSSRFSNRIRLAARVKKLRFHLSLSNNSYSDETFYKPLYFDQYRRLYSFGVSYEI